MSSDASRTPGRETAEALVRSVRHWHQDFEIAPGIWTRGSYKPHYWLDWMKLPASLQGTRALDVGCCDGFHSLALYERGADVTAIDYTDKGTSGFATTEAITGMKVEFHNVNLFDLPVLGLRKFDLVLCLGVLYHLPDPYRGLVILADACATGGRLFIETVAVDGSGIEFPIMRFYPARSLKGTLGNFWGQSPSCLEAMLIDVGFSIQRTHLLAFNEEGNARMIVEAVRVENHELEHRKKVAYNLRAGA